MKNQYILVIATAIASSLVTLMLGALAMVFYVVQPFHKEAVDRGFATWEVTDNATGSTKFTWNEFATALHPGNPDQMFAELEEPLK